MSAEIDATTMAYAESVAAITGSPVLFGVRPDGSFFVHCSGTEFDGPHADALHGVAVRLRQTAERQAQEGERAERLAEGLLRAQIANSQACKEPA
jgi:hypothetical protein